MRRLAFAGLLLLLPPDRASAQAIPAWADVAPTAARIRLPAAWLATQPDSATWIVSWGTPPEVGIWYRPGPYGVFLQVPTGDRPLQARVQHAAVRSFEPSSCGDINCIALAPPDSGRVRVEGELLVIELRTGSALNSLFSIRPDSLRLDLVRAHALSAAAGWLRVSYAP